jgi:hypothetical protein
MVKARSPAYPIIGLKESIDKVTAVYRQDYQNQIPKEVMARHMGYFGLNGKSLGVLSALSKFGLIEGRGDNSRVSDLAVQIIAHEIGSPERAAAIREASARPDLFAELDARYPDGKGSDSAIRSYLLVQKFIPQAADAVIRAYRETKALVDGEGGGYNGASEPVETHHLEAQPLTTPPPEIGRPVLEVMAAGIRRAVFDLSEGEVVITFPDELSAESVSDLADYLDVFMKKARREAGVQ